MNWREIDPETIQSKDQFTDYLNGAIGEYHINGNRWEGASVPDLFLHMMGAIDSGGFHEVIKHNASGMRWQDLASLISECAYLRIGEKQ